MVSKKSTRKLSLFRHTLKELKHWGFIDYDLRKPLNPFQVDLVNDLIKEYKHILSHPDNYVKRRVSDKTKDIWAQHGYVNNEKYLIIPRNGYSTIHVSDKNITRSREDIDQGTGEIFVKRQRIYSETGLDLYDKVMHAFRLPLEEGEMITLKIGKNAPFNKSYDSPEALLNYVANWQPKDKLAVKDDLIAQMSTVRVFIKNK